MAKLSISDVLHLLGGDLRDGSEECERFRNLLNGKVREEDISGIQNWIRECLEHSKEPPYSRAFQDIIVSLGRRLGFEVHYGKYAGKSGTLGVDGIWRGGEYALLLEVKSSTWPLSSIEQLAEYVRTYEKETGAKFVYGLYVLGGGDVKPLIEQIRGSEYRGRLRLIEYSDLLELIGLADRLEPALGEEGAQSKVRQILLPLESINIGNIVKLIVELLELKPPSEDEVIGEKEEGDEIPWSKEELQTFLGESTPYQRLLLTALARMGDQKLTRRQLAAMMNEIAKGNPSLGIEKPITGLDIGGARSGFRMRRKRFKPIKEDILQVEFDDIKREYVYMIKQKYLSAITEWLKTQSLYKEQKS